MIEKNKILIINNNQDNVHGLAKKLDVDFEVVLARDYKSTLNIISQENNEIAVVIVDIDYLSDKSCAFISQVNGLNPDIPVFLLVDSTDLNAKKEALELGAFDYIIKPYNEDLFKLKLTNILNVIKNTKFKSMVLDQDFSNLLGYSEFFERGQRLIDSNETSRFVLINLNINGFKFLNEKFGIETGNDLLVKLDLIFESEMITNRFLATRITGDEFAFVIDLNVGSIAKFKNDLILAMDDLDKTISFRMGIYLVEESGISIRTAYDRAKMASDLATGNEFINEVFYNDDIRQEQMFIKEIVDSFEMSLAHEYFEIHFQPKFNLFDYSIIGAEALIRWNHPNLGFLAPSKFVPILEQRGLIVELDYYVWEKSCQFMRKWIDDGNEIVPISVNLSRCDIFDSRINEFLDTVLKKYDLEHSSMHLEITESYAANDELLIETVNRLKDNGFVIEMDDFGSGYSSLNILDELSIDVIKMDLRFILNRTRNNRVVNYVVDLARKLDLQVIVEGIESLDQIESLKELGCYYGQGYLFSRPLKEAEFWKMLKENVIQSHNNAVSITNEIHYFNNMYALIPFPVFHLDESLYLTYLSSNLIDLIDLSIYRGRVKLGFNVSKIISTNSYLAMMDITKDLPYNHGIEVVVEVELTTGTYNNVSLTIQKIKMDDKMIIQCFLVNINK